MGAYGKFPAACYQLECPWTGRAGSGQDRPTLDEASVREFRVDDLPALGLPTSPIKGSRGILEAVDRG